MTEDLYILPPCILPCDLNDSFNLLFVISASLLPIVHTLNKSLNIKERWFHDKPENYLPKFDYSKIPHSSSIPEMFHLPPVAELYDNNIL